MLHEPLGAFLARNTRMPWAAFPFVPRRGLCIVGAPSKVGKTVFVLNMCYAWACGAPFLHRRTAPMRVLYVDREMGAYGVRERLDAIQRASGEPLALENLAIQCRDKHAIGLETGTPGYANLEAMVADFRPAVTVLDPLRDCFSGDENDSSTMTRVFGAVFALADTYDTAFVLVHHCGKGITETGAKYAPNDPYKMRGSSRIFDVGDSYLMLEKLGPYSLRTHFTLRYHGFMKPVRCEWGENDYLLRWPEAPAAV